MNITRGVAGNEITSGSTQWGYGINFGSGSTHNHGTTGAASGNTTSTTPGATGSASSLPPYLAVYIWKRTA